MEGRVFQRVDAQRTACLNRPRSRFVARQNKISLYDGEGGLIRAHFINECKAFDIQSAMFVRVIAPAVKAGCMPSAVYFLPAERGREACEK